VRCRKNFKGFKECPKNCGNYYESNHESKHIDCECGYSYCSHCLQDHLPLVHCEVFKRFHDKIDFEREGEARRQLHAEKLHILKQLHESEEAQRKLIHEMQESQRKNDLEKWTSTKEEEKTRKLSEWK